MENKTYTPEQIAELNENEIFVFGSNMNGNHAGGAAKTAVDKFGAINGQTIGLQGQSYALPTLSKKMQKLALSTIKRNLNNLSDFAKVNTNLTFYVTKIGCGIVDYDIKDIAELFFSIDWNSNVILPIEFTKREVEPTIKGFKAYKKGMICKGFQYKEGETYEHKGNLVLCPNESDIKRGAGGFHFCQNPLDVLDYYPLIDNEGNITEFSEVEGIGENKSDNNKICTKKIKIGAKLSLKSFTELSFKFLYKSVKIDKTSGNDSKVATSGSYSKVATSGYGSQVATSGSYSKVATSGSYSKVATSGNDSKVATSGSYSKVATSGYGSQVATSGSYSKVATSGNDSRIEAKGNNSVIAAIGKNSMAKGIVGTWITLAEYDNNICICVLSKQIDGVELLADTFYKLKCGKFVKA